MGEDLTNSSSNIPQMTEDIGQLLTYGGSITGSQASSSRPSLFGNARRKGDALAEIIYAEITDKNIKEPPTY